MRAGRTYDLIVVLVKMNRLADARRLLSDRQDHSLTQRLGRTESVTHELWVDGMMYSLPKVEEYVGLALSPDDLPNAQENWTGMARILEQARLRDTGML